jgi:hypothetical protein
LPPPTKRFAKLPAGTVDELLKPENRDKVGGDFDVSCRIAGRVYSEDVAWARNGDVGRRFAPRKISKKDGAISINQVEDCGDGYRCFQRRDSRHRQCPLATG